MPFFFIVPVWLVAVVVSVVLLVVKRTRVIGVYLLLRSTGGVLFSFLFSTAALILGAKVFGGGKLAWLALLGYVAMIGFGGVCGIVAGGFAARKVTAH